MEVIHSSDCAVHDKPRLKNAVVACDCGAEQKLREMATKITPAMTEAGAVEFERLDCGDFLNDEERTFVVEKILKAALGVK